MLFPSPSSGIKWGNDCKVASPLFLPFLLPHCVRMTLSWGVMEWPGLVPSCLQQGMLVFLFFFSCPLTMPTPASDEVLQETILRDSSWVSYAPAAWRSPYCFHGTSTLSETALLVDSLLGKEMSQEFLAVRRVTEVHISSLTPTRISSHSGGPALSMAHWDSHSGFCSHSGFSLFVMDDFQVFNFMFLNHLWRRKNGLCFCFVKMNQSSCLPDRVKASLKVTSPGGGFENTGSPTILCSQLERLKFCFGDPEHISYFLPGVV